MNVVAFALRKPFLHHMPPVARCIHHDVARARGRRSFQRGFKSVELVVLLCKREIVNEQNKLQRNTPQFLHNGRDIARLRGVERARCFGVLSQAHQTGYAFTVDELVRLGRYCHAPRLLQPKSRADQDMVEQALSLTGMTALRYHTLTTLSGGELQRAFLAQLFAQDPPLLILDEPTNHLDLMYQSQIFQLLRDWLAQGGRAVISVVHDLSLARAYGSQALLLDRGRVKAWGPAKQTLSRDLLNQVYGLDVYAWMRNMLGQWDDEKP